METVRDSDSGRPTPRFLCLSCASDGPGRARQIQNPILANTSLMKSCASDGPGRARKRWGRRARRPVSLALEGPARLPCRDRRDREPDVTVTDVGHDVTVADVTVTASPRANHADPGSGPPLFSRHGGQKRRPRPGEEVRDSDIGGRGRDREGRESVELRDGAHARTHTHTHTVVHVRVPPPRPPHLRVCS